MRQNSFFFKRLAIAGAFFCFLTAFPPTTLAFGRDGHTITWLIAQEKLSLEAKIAVQDLLGNMDDEVIPNWADSIKGPRPETKPWHYINFDWHKSAPDVFDLEHNEEGNIYLAINKQIEILKNEDIIGRRGTPRSSLSMKRERAEALLFLIHFVGDVHQPLHCGLEEDWGGNGIKVKIEDRSFNLHSVWDFYLVVKARGDLSNQDFARQLAHEIMGADSLSPAQWIEESRQLMKSVAYKDQKSGPGPFLDEAYLERGAQITRRRLGEAGARIAGLLNEIFSQYPQENEDAPSFLGFADADDFTEAEALTLENFENLTEESYNTSLREHESNLCCFAPTDKDNS
jgi:hypothetical protein